MPPFDAILVPGGGVRAGGELPPWVERRLDRAIERSANQPIISLSAGTTHLPPPLDERGLPIFESVAAAQYLVRKGVPPEHALYETSSYDTIGNAYFARVIHTDPRGWRRLLVINSEFHMPRTEAIFRWVFGLDAYYSLEFDAVPDEGVDQEHLEARRAKEAEAIQRLQLVTARIRTLPDLHRWMFAEHDAYTAERSAFRATRPDERTLGTYS